MPASSWVPLATDEVIFKVEPTGACAQGERGNAMGGSRHVDEGESWHRQISPDAGQFPRRQKDSRQKRGDVDPPKGSSFLVNFFIVQSPHDAQHPAGAVFLAFPGGFGTIIPSSGGKEIRHYIFPSCFLLSSKSLAFDYLVRNAHANKWVASCSSSPFNPIPFPTPKFQTHNEMHCASAS